MKSHPLGIQLGTSAQKAVKWLCYSLLLILDDDDDDGDDDADWKLRY